MTKLNAYLFFDGNCAEAMTFYESVLRGKLELTKQGDSPEPAPSPESADKIMYARLEFEEGVLMASDWLAPQPFEKRQGFSLALGTPSMEEGKRLFDELSAGGHVTMPFGKTFFSEGFGMLVDQFGTAWMVNVEAPAA
jgi:PhnB protein